MEAAYAAGQLVRFRSCEYTIPIDNVQGAYADGYDVWVASDRLQRPSAASLLPSSRGFSGLIDSKLQQRLQIDLIIAGMSAGRLGWWFCVCGFGVVGLKRHQSFSDLAVPLYSAKDTMLDTVIDEIPGVVRKNADRVRFPAVFQLNLLQGTRATP